MAQKIEGLDEVLHKLDKLPERLGNNAMRRAIRKGANEIKNEARRNAKALDDPESPEKIWKNIAVSSGGKRRERAVGGPMVRVGVRGGSRDMSAHGGVSGSGKSNPGGDTFYFRFLEFGTSKMAAKPFLRPAMHSKQGDAFRTAANYMEKELDKEAAKLSKK